GYVNVKRKLHIELSLPMGGGGAGSVLRALTPRKVVIHEHDNADGGDAVPDLCASEYDFYDEADDDGGNAHDSQAHSGSSGFLDA
ncbi:MAG: hypothetical protein OXF98_09925, partial [Rhodospirillaceae bacterium]|nr:hypothetical protein [Rhodospirillaceae bacterium]